MKQTPAQDPNVRSDLWDRLPPPLAESLLTMSYLACCLWESQSLVSTTRLSVLKTVMAKTSSESPLRTVNQEVVKKKHLLPSPPPPPSLVPAASKSQLQ